MRITKFGHSCLLIEEGDARILIDPGAFSQGFENLTELDAILITHQHPDHMVVENIKGLLEKNPTAKVFADEDSAKILNEEGVKAADVHERDTFEVGNVKVEVFGKTHAVIYPSIPDITNVGYFIASKFFYPGDSFTMPSRAAEILAIPAAAPWLKISEPIDYLLAMKPKIAIPGHDAVLSEAGKQVHFGALRRYGQDAGVDFRVLEVGKSTEV